MTSMTVVEGSGAAGWGEMRERARTRRRHCIAGAIVLASVTVMAATPATYTSLAGVLMLAVAAAGGLYAWRLLDELQRRRAINGWAAAGLTVFLLHPVAQLAAPMLGDRDPGEDVFMLSLVMLVVTMAWQRWRD